MPHADLILTGATAHPVIAPPFANAAVAIRSGRIIAIDTATTIDALRGPTTRVLHLAPYQTILPGFVDSHQHLLMYARNRSRLQLWDTTTIDQVLERLHTAPHTLGGWVVAVGHDQGRLAEARHPTLAELDAALPDRPALIYRACTHIALANSAALAAAGVDRNTIDPAGGRIERINGHLTGVLQESAIALVSSAIPATSIDWTTALQSAAREYHRRGITAIGEAALGHIDGAADLTRVQAAHAGGMRLRMYALAYGALAEQALAGEFRPNAGDEWLRIGAIKIFADGTLGGGTAFLTEDYGDEPGNRGWPVMEREALFAQVERAHRAGWQVAIHAIGDATVAMVVDAYEAALRAAPRGGHRHRIEHVEAVHPGLPERMARIGAIAAIQSCFTYWEEGDVTRLGPQLAPWGHAWGALHAAGVRLANGSDNPVLPDFAPLQGIWAAVQRTNHAGRPLAPHQALSLSAAIESYTLGGAYAAFAEHEYGALTPGMRADITVLDGPLDANEPARIRDLAPHYTIVGGEIVFEA